MTKSTMITKTILKYSWVTGLLLMNIWSCHDPEYPTPVPNPLPSGHTANFLFVNVAPDAPSLDMFINNVKTGNSLTFGQAHTGYTAVPITTSGSGRFTSNTNIRSKASTGSIGGVLGSNDAILRERSTNNNNVAVVADARYTLFALDSITRPAPERKLNTSNFGDTTFFNPLTGSYISVVEKAALPPAQRAKLVPIGTVPLGSTDPGGVRFYFVRDNYPTFPNPNSTQSAIRLVQASPRNVNEGLYVRLNPVTPGPPVIALGNNVPYVLSMATPTGDSNFNPSVGSRLVTSTAVNFSLFNTNIAGVPIDYNVQIATDATFTNIIFTSDPVQFAVNKVYTVVVRGVQGGAENRALGVTIVQHN